MKNKILYLECYSGISGDMTVAALLDLGASQEVLEKSLESLNVEGYEIKIGRTKKSGLDACDFDVILKGERGFQEDDNHAHNHGHQHDCKHNHSHEHEHNSHSHVHRNVSDIYKIIDSSEITPKAKEIAKEIFDIIAVSEAKAHGLPVEEVHFHEVGAIDSIVDVVATAVCLDDLDIDEVYVSELYEGKGHVRCQHGLMPVPVPAVVNIAIENNLKLKISDAKGEMV
ncbi:MAG: LarC family nickel insertion protein, partial [Gallicola sp.]|nr:LarC family nickel insertion protein [Gallicola sp.]